MMRGVAAIAVLRVVYDLAVDFSYKVALLRSITTLRQSRNCTRIVYDGN